MAEAVAAVAAAIGAVAAINPIALDPLKQTISSSNEMGEIRRSLDKAMEMLVAQREDHKDMVQRKKTTMMPSNIYNNWIKRVEEVSREVDSLRIKYPKETKRSRWLSFNKRSKFTNKMKKTSLDIFALLEEDLKDFLVHKRPARVVEMKCPRIDNIPTLHQPLEQIVDWLFDKKVGGVRIHGLVGSGKTTIMQNLNNHAKVAEMFEIVIWVTASREGSKVNMDIHDLQQFITQRLKLDIGSTTHLELVASRIREELKDIKYLLLLDDVKEDLDLDQIGVPFGDNGSKIVFTTRLQHVCSSIATYHINVAPLKEKEALNMFKSVLGDPKFEENPYIKQKMPQIVKWCCCHPLTICVAAGVFRVRKSEERWHDGLTNLRKWPEKGDDAMQEIYNKLECCFDFLQDTQKNCFFYSSMYPEDSYIQKDCLLDNWAAEELFDTNDDDVDKMRANGREVLEHLGKVSLLEENTSQQCVKMHKLIRRAALHNMTTKDREILVKYGKALEKPLDVGCFREKKWISLVDSNLNALPDQPDCSMLSTLFLQKNPNLKVIPQAFFMHMHNLRVLDLYDTRITSLPSSFLMQVTLKVLSLQKCVDLTELPQDIQGLKLIVLDIRGSGISNIPPQVVRLVHLRRLLVSFTGSGSMNNTIEKAVEYSEVISRMSMLKELVIDVEEGYTIILYSAIINVVRLTNLSLLQFCSLNKVMDFVKVICGDWRIHFPTEDCFQSYIKNKYIFENKNCQIFIGCDISSHPDIVKFMPCYKFDGEVKKDTILQTLQKEAAIELVNHNSLEHLSILPVKSLNQIYSCVIKDCNRMSTFVNVNVGGSLILNNLKKLRMINLPILKNIYEGPMQGFYSLKTLVLHNCPELEWICSYGVILQLPEIRHLEVKDCSKIKGIFKESSSTVSPILPKLKKLILVNMPQLQSIMVNGLFDWPSLERLDIFGCPNLKSLPFRKDGAIKLKSIQTEQSWWEALENDREVKEHFQQCCTLS